MSVSELVGVAASPARLAVVEQRLGLLHLLVHLFAARVEEGAEGARQRGDDGDRPEVEDQLEDLAEVGRRVGHRGAGEELRGGEEEGVEEVWISVCLRVVLGEVDDSVQSTAKTAVAPKMIRMRRRRW